MISQQLQLGFGSTMLDIRHFRRRLMWMAHQASFFAIAFCVME